MVYVQERRTINGFVLARKIEWRLILNVLTVQFDASCVLQNRLNSASKNHFSLCFEKYNTLAMFWKDSAFIIDSFMYWKHWFKRSNDRISSDFAGRYLNLVIWHFTRCKDALYYAKRSVACPGYDYSISSNWRLSKSFIKVIRNLSSCRFYCNLF